MLEGCWEVDAEEVSPGKFSVVFAQGRSCQQAQAAGQGSTKGWEAIWERKGSRG